MEATWKTQKGAPLVLFAIPNDKTRQNDYAIEVPKLASFILKHDFNGELKGLDDFAPDHPPVAPVFFAFRAMVGMGVLMIVVAWFSAFLIYRKKAFPTWWLWTLSAFTFAGWFATLCGWLVTEIGRQPWLVAGILRTADAAGGVREASLGASLTLYLVTYVLMFVAYMVVLTHLAGKGAEK
jgi:cytochrome d ubiquinol oxidase subunit I